MSVLSSAPRVERRAIGLAWVAIEGPTVLEIATGEVVVGTADELVRAGAGDLVCVAPRARCRLRGARGGAQVEQLEADSTWVERAKALLRHTEMTVLEVAGETGWSSLAHFNSVFRRRVGYTPSQFRTSAAR